MFRKNQQPPFGVVLSMEAVMGKAVSCNGGFISKFYVLFGKSQTDSVHEARAVESPHAETEPVVVFLTLSALTPTH